MGTAVHQLVAQGINAREDNGQHFGRIATGQHPFGAVFAIFEPRSPFRLGEFAVAPVSKTLEYAGVIQQHANGA